MSVRGTRAEHLTHPRTVALGALWNVLGRIGPLIVAVGATPFLIRELGVARWGVFTLALSLIGMFGIFDFGVGRALTRLIADRLATGEEAQAASSVRTGIVVLTALGAVGAVVMALGAHLYTTLALHLPPALEREVLAALYVLCASAPLVVLNAALWGVLSAFQRFASANLVNLPILAMYYLGPLLVLPFFNSLVAVMLVLVACRVVMTYFYWRICVQSMPSLRQARFAWGSVLPVLQFGGWLTVSNFVWPLMLYMDRFVIAAVLSAAATAYYATPFDLIVRFSVVPVAIMQTAFPAITTAYRQSPQHAARLFRFSSLAIAVGLLAPTLVVIGFAEPLLRLWLGASFAAQASGVLRLLGAGVLFMCADTVPAGLLDGIGRPDLNAKLAVASLLLYVPALFALIHGFGIAGAALAWAGRVIATYAARLLIAWHSYRPLSAEMLRLLPPLVVALFAVLTMLAARALAPQAVVLAGCLAVFGAVVWLVALTAEERAYVQARIRRRR